ncbi:MAG: universal stress protein, partial [Chloroflexi bacterium]|nr:universal stress protein [Chloroflexota bacterium]
MYNKILVPLDGSELAEVTLPYAEDLSTKFGSEIILLHLSKAHEVEQRHMFQIYVNEIINETRENVRKYYGKNPADLKIKAEILIGDAAEQIVDYSDQNNIDLIILATHGESGIKRWDLGSVAQKVIAAAGKPVILVRAKNVDINTIRQRGTIRKILLPLDSSKQSESVMPYVQEMAKKLDAEVTLLEVISLAYPTYTAETFTYITYSEQQVDSIKGASLEYLKKVSSEFNLKGIKNRIEVKLGTPAEEIIKYADENMQDIIAMYTHGR